MHSIAFANGAVVHLPAPVLRDIPDSHARYILLDSNLPNTITDNVLCFDEFGNLKWRIEDVMSTPSNNTFGEGRIRKDGTLEFWNTDDVWISVDKETGRAIGYRAERMGPGGEEESQKFLPIFWRGGSGCR